MPVGWPHAPNGLWLSMHPSDSTHLHVSLKTPSLLDTFTHLRQAFSLTPIVLPEQQTPRENPLPAGPPGAVRPGSSVHPNGVYRNPAVPFTPLLLIPRCCYCYFKL